MISLLKEVLNTTVLTEIGSGQGCISSGNAYRTAEGKEVFVKVNKESEVS